MKWANILKDKQIKLLQELVSLNSAVSIKEMEFLVKSLPTSKPVVLAVLTAKFHQTSK